MGCTSRMLKESQEQSSVPQTKGQQIILVGCKLFKQMNGSSDFMSMHDATICDFAPPICSTITARYWKGIGNHKDNMVLVIWK